MPAAYYTSIFCQFHLFSVIFTHFTHCSLRFFSSMRIARFLSGFASNFYITLIHVQIAYNTDNARVNVPKHFLWKAESREMMMTIITIIARNPCSVDNIKLMVFDIFACRYCLSEFFTSSCYRFSLSFFLIFSRDLCLFDEIVRFSQKWKNNEFFLPWWNCALIRITRM